MKLFNVYLVGDCGPEHDSLDSIHLTYKGALMAFLKLRLELLRDASKSLKSCLKTTWGTEMYERMIHNLSEKDPEKIDNYPHNTPYIRKIKLEW